VRLQLKPGLRRAWRDPGSVQIGVSPRQGTVVEGLTEADARLLDRLRHGVDPERIGPAGRHHELVRLLGEAGVLVPARAGRAALARVGAARERLAADASVWSVVHPPAGDGWEVLARRAARHVAVLGAGRTGTALAVTLAAAGVGRVSIADARPVAAADVAPAGHSEPDIGRRRQDSAADAVRRFGASVPAGHRPHLAVLVDHSVADTGRAEALLRADIPHLSVVIRDGDAVVGPLVRPGHGPCLRCLDLHRSDRDPAWPQVQAQLLRPVAGAGGEPEETATAALVAGLAALQVLGHLDGLARPASTGATLEVELPDGLVSRREWPAHPRCGCHWPPAC
jgi:bacteriocin biosynthesis cyclodehydratase domain-containing protein